MPHFSRPLREVGIFDCVERTLLSAAFDPDREGHEFTRADLAPQERNSGSAAEASAHNYSVILRRVLCAEGSLHPYPHPSRLREFSRRPRRFSPTIKNAAISGRAILGTYSTFPCSWDNRESRPHLSRHARVGRTLLSDAFDLDLDFAGARPELCNPVEERRFSAA